MEADGQPGVGRQGGARWPARYRLRIMGQLDGHWSEWLSGMQLRHGDAGDTVLEGELADQAALYGLLSRLRDLGLTLITVQRAGEDGAFDSS